MANRTMIRTICKTTKINYRIFKNTDEIKWVKPVHEVIDGAKTYSHLPPHEELTLKHVKDIKRQEIQNKLYEDIL